MSSIHDYLISSKLDTLKSPINLYIRISDIKESAKTWLDGLGKNGFNHSERLEGYLDVLTKPLRETNKITHEEIFILLCSVYMHDIGYQFGGLAHAEKSREMILSNPSKYHFGDFPLYGQDPRVAIAVAWVCAGHDPKNIELDKIPESFPDQVFSERPHPNLRKLTALLRLADETDDPYVRFNPSTTSIRDRIPLVEIERNTIIWHWDSFVEGDIFEFNQHIEDKKRNLNDSIEYLERVGIGYYFLVLKPQVGIIIPFMVPKTVHSFVGRISDLETIHMLFRRKNQGSVVAIKGIAGVGKTELTRKYAEVYRKEYPGGVFLASLEGSSWKEEAEKIVSASTPSHTRISFLTRELAIAYISRGVLAQKNTLLIIDGVQNNEDIITPGCSVLLTTRDGDILNNLPSTAIYELKPLPTQNGIELLSQILGENRVNNDKQGALRLQEIIGGLPYALEIAARHLRDVPDLSFSDYIGKIKNIFYDEKVNGAQNKDIFSSLNLSLDQLKHSVDGEIMLSLFNGASICADSGFLSTTLLATVGIGSIDKVDGKEIIAKLSQRSLLQFDATSNRYSMHPIMRQLARMRLKKDPDVVKRYTRNHFTHFLHFAEAHNDDIPALINEKDGLWQALIQANEFEDAVKNRYYLLEQICKPYWNLIKEERYQDAFAFLINMNLSKIHELAEYKALITLLEPLIDHYTEFKIYLQVAYLNFNGICYAALSEYEKGIEFYNKALQVAHNNGDYQGEVNVLGNLGIIYADQGDYHKAIEQYKKQNTLARAIGDSLGLSNSLCNMGIAYKNLCEYQKAIEFYEKALEIARKSGDLSGESTAFGNMGLVYTEQGKYKEAVEYLNRQISLSRKIGDLRAEGNAIGNLGRVHLELEDYKTTIETYEKRIEIARRIGDILGENVALGNMGLAYLHLNNYAKAEELLRKQLQISRKIGDIREEANALSNLGLVCMKTGNLWRAFDLVDKASVLHHSQRNYRGEASDLSKLAILYHFGGGHDEESKGCMNEAKEIYRKLGLYHMIKKLEKLEESCKEMD